MKLKTFDQKGLSPVFTHSGTSIPFPPETKDDCYLWKWDQIFNTGVDISYSFPAGTYLGCVSFKLGGYDRVELIPESGAHIQPKKSGDCLIGEIGEPSDRLTIRVYGNLENLTLSDLCIYAIEDYATPLLHLPTINVDSDGEGVKLGGAVKSSDADERYASEFLLEALDERLGASIGGSTSVRFTKVSEGYEGERYRVVINKREIVVTASERRGLLMGACRIAERSYIGEDGCVYVKSGTIDTKPDTEMRGFHMGLPRVDRIPFAKALFRHILLPMGYNQVIIEFNGAMRFDSHPEISEAWEKANRRWREGKQPRIQHGEMGADSTLLEKSDVRELVSYLDELGIEIIPEVQSLGHVQYLTNAHPELAELEENKRRVDDERAADAMPDDFYYHAYCPSIPESISIITDIMNEIIEVCHPKRFVHIGHDEVYQIGKCPICQKRDKSDIYVEHINTLDRVAKQHGLSLMIWSDMLHTDLGYAFGHEKALPRLPEDIVLLDFTWYFHFDKDIEDELLPYGRKMLMGNLYSSHYPRYSTRITKKGMVGGELSTWTAFSEEDLADLSKQYDLIYTAEMLWNAYSYRDESRRSLSYIIGKEILPRMRDLIHGRSKKCARSIESLCFDGELTDIPTELLTMYPTLRVPKYSITVGKKCDIIALEQASLYPVARVAWKPLKQIGEYKLIYEDGSDASFPVRYGGDVLAWRNLYAEPLPQQYYRHQGYIGTWYADPTTMAHTESGSPVLFLTKAIDNPYPEKIIKEVVYTPATDDTAILILKDISIISNE